MSPGRRPPHPRSRHRTLRYAPRTFRRWSPFLVAGAALGGIACLADHEIGASVVPTDGAPSGITGILVAAVIIFLTRMTALTKFPARTQLAVVFVIVSQLKINVTNAYSGSLSRSNVFSRVMHAHPGTGAWQGGSGPHQPRQSSSHSPRTGPNMVRPIT